jgi:hypothetical protein
VDDDDRGLFRPDEADKTMTTTGVFFTAVEKPFCGGAEAGDGRKVEIGRERESRRREEREAMGYTTL